MYFLIYSSYALNEFSSNQLKELLIHAREKNKKLQITGLLLLFGYQFVQLLEGNETEVKLLFKEICKDKRHKGVVVLEDGISDQRIFPDWSMGFNTSSPDEMEQIAGYKKLNSSSALELLKKLSADN